MVWRCRAIKLTNETSAWFDDLNLRCREKMIKVAAYRLRDHQMAEDLVQDVFELLWIKRDRPEMRNHPNPIGWLMKTLEFLINNEVKGARYREQLIGDEALAKFPAPEDEGTPLADALPSGLSEGQRSLLLWFYDEGRTYADIAAELGISEANCRMRMTRARRRYLELKEADEKKEDAPVTKAASQYTNLSEGRDKSERRPNWSKGGV